MKKYLFLLLISCVSVVSMAQDSLRIKLDSLLRDPMFETSQVGLMVYDLTADSVYYQHNARQLLRPASTMKLVTAITALDQLGSSYQFRTRLYHTGTITNHRLNGDIYCVGGFDPMVDMDDVKAFARELHSMGVDTLRGRIVVDCSMKENLDYGEGWCWDDDNPRLKPLMVGRKDIFASALVDEMINDSIVIESIQQSEGRCPANATHVATRTHSMDQVLLRMMKQSDNFYAEAMFYQIAASTNRRPAKASDARNIVKQLIRKLGLGSQPYKIADGSGLSLYNYVSAELETKLLRYAFLHSNIYDHLLPSLPIAGMDGTLEKRMMKGAASSNVRAKTGTLTGISSLAGYCVAANGHQLCFCIINQGVMRNQSGKDFQDRICQVLCE
jgi:D-alanyl-D-alanine carboxypeptidase/D-alanyl-D-alanine-endopeptidase (penicillin-binding protein 4)